MAINIEKIEYGDSGEKASNIIYNNDKRIVDNVYEKSETYNNTEVDSLLTKKSDKVNTYTKTEVHDMFASASSGIVRKGEVATVAALNNIANPQKGWTYLVTADGYLYQYDGSVWNNTGIKGSNYEIEQQTGQSTNTVMSQKAVTDELDNKLSLSGGTITGDLYVDGRVNISGDTNIGGSLFAERACINHHLLVNDQVDIGKLVNAGYGTIANDLQVDGKIISGKTVYGQSTGHDINTTAFEAKGNGRQNTISPGIAFNQPNVMDAEILLKGTDNSDSTFHFIRNGSDGNYADIQAGDLVADSFKVNGGTADQILMADGSVMNISNSTLSIPSQLSGYYYSTVLGSISEHTIYPNIRTGSYINVCKIGNNTQILGNINLDFTTGYEPKKLVLEYINEELNPPKDIIGFLQFTDFRVSNKVSDKHYLGHCLLKKGQLDLQIEGLSSGEYNGTITFSIAYIV